MYWLGRKVTGGKIRLGCFRGKIKIKGFLGQKKVRGKTKMISFTYVNQTCTIN